MWRWQWWRRWLWQWRRVTCATPFASTACTSTSSTPGGIGPAFFAMYSSKVWAGAAATGTAVLASAFFSSDLGFVGVPCTGPPCGPATEVTSRTIFPLCSFSTEVTSTCSP